MNTNPNSNSKSVKARLTRRWVIWGLAGGVVVIALAAVALGMLEKGNLKENPDLITVSRGPLVISVSLSGTINNREKIILRSEVEGRTTLLSLISEGSRVKAGDVLLELDSSALVEQKSQQQITVTNAESSFVRARENQAVTRSQGESDVAKAELAFKFAKTDLDKYLEGEYPQSLKQADADIQIAEEELKRAKDKLEWSERLANEGLITRTELEADRLAATRNELSVQLSKAKLELLRQYTYPRQVEQLRSDVAQAEMALERTKRKSAADNIQAEAELTARQSELDRQKAKLVKIDEQIRKCTIVAPVDGMVVYATTGQGGYRGNDQPLMQGLEVRERQELIHLPTNASMMVDVKVPESSLGKVVVGMPVRVTVDALPGRTLFGRVGKIAPVVDQTSVWLNPDLKVYATEIYLEGDGADLRPGMNCRAEIVIDQYPDALYLPVQTVVRREGRTVVYLPNGQPREVKIGLDNNRMVRILEGLAQGDNVLMAPPLAPSTVSERDQTMPTTTQPAELAHGPAAAPQPTPAEPDGATPSGGASIEERRRQFDSMTPEQREAMIRQYRESGGQNRPEGMPSGSGRPGGGRRRPAEAETPTDGTGNGAGSGESSESR